MALPEYPPEILVAAAKLPPAEAIAFFRAKGFKINWDWHETLGNANNKVFQVAKAVNLDVLKDIRGEVDKAIAEGSTFKTFQKELEPKLAKKGWTGHKFLKNPNTGKVEVVELGTPRRLKTIYRTNTQSAYNAGRWEVQHRGRARRPYLMLIEILDGSTRHNHKVMSGSIAKVTSKFWNKWYPPNGFNCRGRTRSLKEAEAKRRGIRVKGNLNPDPGFTGNPGLTSFAPQKKDYPPELWQASKAMKPKKFVDSEPKFVPAKSRKGAEQFAVDTGLAKKADYRGTDLDTANMINKTLTELHSGGPLFNRIKPTASRGSLFFVESSRRVKDHSLTKIDFAFSKVNAKSDAAIRNFTSAMKDQKLIVDNPTPSQLVTHEYGHFVDQSKSAFSSQQAQKLNTEIRNHFITGSGFNKDLSKYFAAMDRLHKKIGDYMATNDAEQFAELYRVWKSNKLPAEFKFVGTFFNEVENAANSMRDVF